jgi:hypothetical protein
MTTPIGGTDTVSYWFDGEGNPCEPEVAVSGEIVELDGNGMVLRRTYMDRDPELVGEVVVHSREDEALNPFNQDFTKSTWDVRNHDQSLVTTLEQLLPALGVGRAPLREQRETVGNFLSWPSATGAPAELIAECHAWLLRTRQE